MKGKMPRSNLRRTPKVFGTSYQPVKTSGRNRLVVPSKAWRPIISLVVVVAVALLVARLPFFQIQTVTVDGSSNPELAAELQELVGHSIFTSQISRVTNRWLGRDQSLATFVCRRGVPNSVRCSVALRQGVLVWRQGTSEFWVDENGRAFASRQADQPSPLIVEDRLTKVVNLGDDVASREIIDVLIRLQQELGKRSIVVRHFFINDVLYQPGALVTAFPLANQSVVQKEVSVIFTATETVTGQVRILTSLLAERGEKIDSRIDLRVPGYVYYH